MFSDIMKTAIVFGLMSLTVSTTRRTVKTLHEITDEEWETFKVSTGKKDRKNKNIILS